MQGDTLSIYVRRATDEELARGLAAAEAVFATAGVSPAEALDAWR